MAVMAVIRLLSGLLEIAAALLFLRANRVSYALRVNSLMGLAGPLFFAAVGAVGATAVRARLPMAKLAALCVGMLLVLWGTAGL